MTSEITQLTVFSRICQKKSYFLYVFKFGSIVRFCEHDLYFYQRCIFVGYVYSRNMNLVCDVALYLRKELRGKNLHLFLQFLTIIEKSQIFYVMYLNHVHILKSVIFQEVLNIPYFKIIPTFSQKFDNDFWGPKLAHILYSPLSRNQFRSTAKLTFLSLLQAISFCLRIKGGERETHINRYSF